MFKDATIEEINKSMNAAWDAFHQYRKMPLKKRADWMSIVCNREVLSSTKEKIN